MIKRQIENGFMKVNMLSTKAVFTRFHNKLSMF